MWQELYQELKAQGFTVLAVAFDSRQGAAAPWVQQAKPGFACLVDPFHHVADLYNMVNVNQAVWIDESGRMVRPTETAGAYESFRKMNRRTGAPDPDAANTAEQVKKHYHDAVRDWVAKGAASQYALDKQTAMARLSLPNDDVAKAHASFVLGQYLIATGNAEEGDELVRAASELHPDSWAIWRQGAQLDERGLAATADFWTRVDALGSKRYYAVVDMPGMPDHSLSD